MRAYKAELEVIAIDLLEQTCSSIGDECKPNYSNRDFMNALIIFQNALMDKMYDLQCAEKMDIQDKSNMAEKCGLDLRDLIKTYTGLDTHKIEDFLK